MKNSYTLFIIPILAFLLGCNKQQASVSKSDLNISFTHVVEDEILELNQMKYTNANGDTFSIKSLKYFISNFTLHTEQGEDLIIPSYWYIDVDDQETLNQQILQEIPFGTYTAISFTLGLSNGDNISNIFDRGPEELMAWPENLGGGYHYQKLEGQYLTDGVPHNYNLFSGPLDNIDYSVRIIEHFPLTITRTSNYMNIQIRIQNWMNSPIAWDFDYFGADITQNHEAQETLQKNGYNVSSIGIMK